MPADLRAGEDIGNSQDSYALYSGQAEELGAHLASKRAMRDICGSYDVKYLPDFKVSTKWYQIELLVRMSDLR